MKNILAIIMFLISYQAFGQYELLNEIIVWKFKIIDEKHVLPNEMGDLIIPSNMKWLVIKNNIFYRCDKKTIIQKDDTLGLHPAFNYIVIFPKIIKKGNKWYKTILLPEKMNYKIFKLKGDIETNPNHVILYNFHEFKDIGKIKGFNYVKLCQSNKDMFKGTFNCRFQLEEINKKTGLPIKGKRIIIKYIFTNSIHL